MSENVFGQCATLIGRAAIQKNLLVVPTPTEGDSGKALVANQDGSTEWGRFAMALSKRTYMTGSKITAENLNAIQDIAKAVADYLAAHPIKAIAG